jgi:hypothetical protein
MAGKRGRVFFGMLNLLVAALVGWCTFRGLPTRWWPVDAGGAVVVGLFAASGAALLSKHRYAEALTRLAGFVVLGLGMLAFALLAATAGWLAGVYGPVGKAGSAVFGLVAALVLPYLVVLPAVELAWVGPRAR